MKTKLKIATESNPLACSRSSETPETDALQFEVIDDYECGINVVSSCLARKLERERDNAIAEATNAVNDIILVNHHLKALREQVRLTIMENLHLADGDVCTLKQLKDAIGFDLDSENA